MSIVDFDRTAAADGGGPPEGDGPGLEAVLVARAAACGPVLAANAARYDRVGAWVHDSFETVREAGLLSVAVPVELGGDGASVRQVAMVQRELAKHCGSTALASAMHQHVTAFTAWRYRRGLPGAEATLRRIAQERIVVVSTGGGDYTHPKGEARKVDGGYMVSGRKSFVSQAPVGAVLSTMFPYDDPERGRRALNMAVPFSAPGVSVIENWDTHGMRGTASHDVDFDNVFVADDKIMADRPHGTIDGPLQVISSIGFAVISAVYLGIAEGVRAHILHHLDHRPTDQSIHRRVGLIDHRLRIAGWALDGALTTIGDDPTPTMANVVAVMAAKREIALAAAEVCDTAMQLAGRAAFTKGNPIERAHRDVRAAPFHPLDPEQTLIHAGRVALELPNDQPTDWAH
jgi:alkylation response protein AidB-like acyl-CoA dehydrogenase